MELTENKTFNNTINDLFKAAQNIKQLKGTHRLLTALDTIDTDIMALDVLNLINHQTGVYKRLFDKAEKLAENIDDLNKLI